MSLSNEQLIGLLPFLIFFLNVTIEQNTSVACVT